MYRKRKLDIDKINFMNYIYGFSLDSFQTFIIFITIFGSGAHIAKMLYLGLLNITLGGVDSNNTPCRVALILLGKASLYLPNPT